MSKVPKIGDVGPGGGQVFITPSTKGNSTSMYFEAAPRVVKAKWDVRGKILGAEGTAIGTGATNTATAAAFCSSGAIHIASNYSNNDFSDWFLPSQDELNEMYVNRKSLGGFSTGYYWSSSEFTTKPPRRQGIINGVQGGNYKIEKLYYTARSQGFVNGVQGGNYKNYMLYVRPVRAFS